MQARNEILASSFIDIDTENDRLQFARDLLDLDKHTRIEILNEQYTINPENIPTLLAFLLGNEETIGNLHSDLLRDIEHVGATPEVLVSSFVQLPTDLQIQFVIRLLTLDVDEKKVLLAQQETFDIRNIDALHSFLISNTRDFFQNFPGYTSLLDRVKAMLQIIPVENSFAASPAEIPTEESLSEELSEEDTDEELSEEDTDEALSEEDADEALSEEDADEALSEEDADEALSEEDADEEISAASTAEIPQQNSLCNEFFASCEELFNDPIWYTPIKEPVITPSGVSYDITSISECLKKKSQDPSNRKLLYKKDLLSNTILKEILEIFKSENFDLEKLRSLFICPIADEPFKDPVVASNGVTYERKYIELLIRKNNYLKDKRLYPNRFIKDLMGIKCVSELITSTRTPLEEKNASFIQPLQNYQETRLREKDNPLLLFSYKKLPKLQAAIHLKRVLSGKMAPQMFFTQHKYDLKVLQQGRLKKLAEPGLTEARKMQSKT